jgi:hypothetical protein
MRPRLLVPRPATWPVPGIRLRVEPLRPLPDDVGAYAIAAITRQVPPDHRLVTHPLHRGVSELGWPLLVADGELHDAKDTVVQRRSLFVYQLVDWIGIVRVLVTDLAAWTDQRAAILGSLGRAMPDFGDGSAACLAEALSVDPR